MERTICELVISVKIYSFFNTTIEYVFKRDSLDKLDEMTYFNQDAKTFFEKYKKEVYVGVRPQYEREYVSAITDIALGENGIYIRKRTKKIRALFKKIDYGNRQFDLESVVLSRLYKQNLTVLFACDQYRKRIEDYDSFFEDFSDDFLKRAQFVQYSEEDVLFFWEYIKGFKRFYPLLRFLLEDYSHYDGDISEFFIREVPAKEIQLSERKPSKELTYRLPYKDN